MAPTHYPRRSTGSTTETTTSRCWQDLCGRSGRRQKRDSPQDPSVPAAEEEEGAPVPRGTKVEGRVADILQTLSQQEKDFPEFDSLGPYLGLADEDTAPELWRSEAERLFHFAVNPSTLLRFSNQTFFKEANKKGYDDLSRLSEGIMFAIKICLLDNERISIKYLNKPSSRQKLLKLIRQVGVGQTPKGETDDTLDAMYSLIDYISAVLARLITQTAVGGYWLNNLLGVLAKHVTKIKVLLLHMQENINISVEAGEATPEKYFGSGEGSAGDLEDEDDYGEALRIINADKKEGLKLERDAEVASYCVKQSMFRSGINEALEYILLSLRCPDRSWLPAPEFDICAVAYGAGFKGFKILLFQDKDQEYSATSDLNTLSTAHSAFNILRETVGKLAEANQNGYKCDMETTVEWAFEDTIDSCDILGVLLGQRKSLSLKSMEDAITVMVPFATTSPVLVADFARFKTMVALTGNADNVVHPYKAGYFTAFFSMRAIRSSETSRKGVPNLSQAVLDCKFTRYRLITGKPKDHYEKNVIEKFKTLAQKMDAWVIDETSVTVQCSEYVWSVAIAAGVLAAGGLAIGLSVGQRIHGVDPTNIAMYAWVLAAFIILICKSVMVKDWAWSDFLRRRVRCVSVSELEAVTKINCQMIIARLLHDEHGGSPLKTRGPFNSIFMNHSADGFSIDQRVETNTLVVSGLYLINVVTPHGPAIVCLDLRRGTDLKVVQHQGDQSGEFLVCEDANRQYQEGSGSSSHKKRLQLTRTRTFKWTRVQDPFIKDFELA